MKIHDNFVIIRCQCCSLHQANEHKPVFWISSDPQKFWKYCFERLSVVMHRLRKWSRWSRILIVRFSSVTLPCTIFLKSVYCSVIRSSWSNNFFIFFFYLFKIRLFLYRNRRFHILLRLMSSPVDFGLCIINIHSY